MVIDGTDEIKVSGQREVGFAHDIYLPESVGVRSLKSLYPLDRRQSDPAEMMTNQNSPDSLPVNGEFKMVLNEPGGSMLSRKL